MHATQREQWSKHPHYPSQVLLLGSHDNFRRVSRQLIQAVQGGESLDLVGPYYVRWIAAMRSHEAYEEHKLYPYLARRWDASFAEASDGHEALHACDRRVRAAFLLPKDGPAGARHEIVAALEAHDQALRTHLDLEEELVIPLLLALTPQEFARLNRLPISTLLDELGSDREAASAH